MGLAPDHMRWHTDNVVAETRYAKYGNYNIAYQVVGEGPFDLLWVPGFVSNVELAWEEPLLARFLDRLASFSRLILFDKRGTGLSDRLPDEQLPTLEERMEDVIAVLDAAGSERAALLGHSEGGNLAVLFAASHPSRTAALVTAGIFAKRVWSPDYPWAPTPEQRARDIDALERNWGVHADVEHLAPSAARDPAFGRRLATYFRRSASPGAAGALIRMNTQIDIRADLPTLRVPTLMLRCSGDRDTSAEEARWIAAQVPGARFVELPGDDHLPWVGDQDRLLDEVQEFLTGTPRVAIADRVLTTVLVTDIVGSTKRATELGDRAWSALVDSHHALVRAELVRFRGLEIDTAGDGFLATFDGPARAVRCACAIADAVRALGIEVRAGVHTGECEFVGDRVRGVAVHTGARVAALAGPGEVLVSSTITGLVAGSGLEFEDRGEHALKGLDGLWRIHAVVR
jgi:pimeloyl-ACP methyl ester carboxylesterase